jgi:hypothetical protein
MLEVIQMTYERQDYIKDPWNIVEAAQITLNVVLISILLSNQQLKSKTFVVIVLCLTMIKFLKQLKVFVSLGMLVLLIFQCISDSVPFVMYLVIWIIFFDAILKFLGAQMGDEIDDVGLSLSNYINFFRSSVGDIQDPKSLCTNDNKDECE